MTVCRIDPGPTLQPPDPGRGRRLGIDAGSVRIGVAVSDPDGILATPVETVSRAAARVRTNTCAAWRRWSTNSTWSRRWWGYRAHWPTVRGRLPTDAIGLADQLAARIAPVPVRLADERFTTVAAQRSLREAGVRAKGQRSMIDQAAAVGILQNWLDQRRAETFEPRTEEVRGCLTTGAVRRGGTRCGRPAAGVEGPARSGYERHAAGADVN